VRRARSRLSVIDGGDDTAGGALRPGRAGTGSSIGGGAGFTGTSTRTTGGSPSPPGIGDDCGIGADRGGVIGGDAGDEGAFGGWVTGGDVIGREAAADGVLDCIGGGGAVFAVGTLRTPGTIKIWLHF